MDIYTHLQRPIHIKLNFHHKHSNENECISTDPNMQCEEIHAIYSHIFTFSLGRKGVFMSELL